MFPLSKEQLSVISAIISTEIHFISFSNLNYIDHVMYNWTVNLQTNHKCNDMNLNVLFMKFVYNEIEQYALCWLIDRLIQLEVILSGVIWRIWILPTNRRAFKMSEKYSNFLITSLTVQ